jgi:hypothetical protein
MPAITGRSKWIGSLSVWMTNTMQNLRLAEFLAT